MRFQVHRRCGFTLLELAIAVVLLVLLMMLAVPSMTGVMADRRLRKSLDGFNAIVREAQERSMAEGRPYLIVWQDKGIGLGPEGLMGGDDSPPEMKFEVAK